MERTKKASAMSKQLVSVFLLGALIACETKTPSGPSGVTPTTSTTTTVSPTTAPTTTTTTIPVITSLARSFKAFPPPPPNQPSEMTLFFKLIAASPVVAQAVEGVTASANGENIYIVSGVYVMGNGTTGAVDGELKGVNPLENGGNFGGSITAKTPSGCQAERDFGGSLNSSELLVDRRRTRHVHLLAESTRQLQHDFDAAVRSRCAAADGADDDHYDVNNRVDDDDNLGACRPLHVFVYTGLGVRRCQRRRRCSHGFDCDRRQLPVERAGAGALDHVHGADPGHGSGDR